MLGWLRGQVFASIFISVVLVKGLEYLWGGVTGYVRGTIVVGVWTMFTTVTGMRAFTEAVKRLRHGNKDVSAVNKTASIEAGKGRT